MCCHHFCLQKLIKILELLLTKHYQIIAMDRYRRRSGPKNAVSKMTALTAVTIQNDRGSGALYQAKQQRFSLYSLLSLK